MRRHGDLLERIELACTRASAAEQDPHLLAEIEDLLAEGYLEAMMADARSRHLGLRLEELVEQLDDPRAGTEARRIALERRGTASAARVLRARLSALREHFARLSGIQSISR
jgi:hypothetical protein